MKNFTARQEAQQLFLQSDLTKSQIAETLGVSRRTIYQWSVEDNWDKLQKSAQHLPAFIAEKFYYILSHLTDAILSSERKDPVTPAEVNMLARLTTTLSKLKNGSTINECMQSFTFFLDHMQRHDPELAVYVAPHIQSFVQARTNVKESGLLMQGFNNNMRLHLPDNEAEAETPTTQEPSGNEDELMESIYTSANASTPIVEEPQHSQQPDRRHTVAEPSVLYTPAPAPPNKKAQQKLSGFRNRAAHRSGTAQPIQQPDTPTHVSATSEHAVAA